MIRRPFRRVVGLALVSACLLAWPPVSGAQDTGGREGREGRGGRSGRGAAAAQRESLFDAREEMIPTRDGVKLHTIIYSPKVVTEDLPFIFVRTPYGIGQPDRGPGAAYAELVADGYIFVFQDIRGRFQSEGEFEMLRMMRNPSDPGGIDESTDTYDTIEWLLKNVPRNNGKVGMMGVSYPGWLTVMAMLDPHPALKAVSPQASPSDMFLGDDFHHNGAFRLSYGFEYATMMEGSRALTSPFAFNEPDLYDWYLKLGSLANINARHLRGAIPTWNNFATHHAYDAFWQRQSVHPFLTSVKVPTLNIAGWWDQEDFYGPITIYRKLEVHDSRNLNYLVVGPWNHGGWSTGGRTGGQNMGPLDFGSPTSTYYRRTIQAPWFAYWLKGRGQLNLAEATVFETGSNEWRREDSWPARNTTARKLYFHADGALSFTAPTETATNAFDSYVSDPASPVPYRRRPIRPTFRGGTWSTWLMDDQRFLKGRPDVMTWRTEPLAEDVVVAGDITARLFASTTGSDADWVVKLIDVYPETYSDTVLAGYQLMVANDVFRGRFRESFERPEPIPPNRTQAYSIDLHTQAYNFRKGHRIMVQVQSTWFPLIDRNPQKFVPNIFEAKDSDFQAATHRIYRSRQAPSHVEIAVRNTTR